MTEEPREKEVGFIVEAMQYVLTLDGLPTARIGDLIVREEGGERAIVRSFTEGAIVALALDPMVTRSGDRFSHLADQKILSAGEHLFGRVVTPLGDAADLGAPLPRGGLALALDAEAPGIEARVSIDEQLATG